MSNTNKELNVSNKQEIKTHKEPSIPGIKYSPATDIVETGENLLVYMDMPGVSKKDIKIKVEKNILEVDGQIDTDLYLKYKPVYSEYNLGHYNRAFELTSEIDQSQIEAKIDDGVLTLTLPKVPEKQPKLIAVN